LPKKCPQSAHAQRGQKLSTPYTGKTGPKRRKSQIKKRDLKQKKRDEKTSIACSDTKRRNRIMQYNGKRCGGGGGGWGGATGGDNQKLKRKTSHTKLK